MLERIINYSIHHKLIILLFTAALIAFGVYSLFNIPIGAVPDVTNNQVQVITTSRNLATQDVEKFLTYPVELEMANLPGVKEIRSVSKFGLSVVTVVFEDDIGTYLPRQLIAEKIKSAEEKIPQGFGSPFMGPVSTGLGEIYQYIIDVAPEYKDKYSITDVRTIQDWLVKRQLSGIPGVVEVNTWGGFLKQYEVAIDPSNLRAMNISITEVYNVLAANNSVAGGGYIEKVNESYFIRGEGMVNSLSDIENIVVEVRSGIPLFIKDIARVGFGHATRFGAITANGEGETGQVMMLKDANSKAVIEAVKDRVEEIQASLPPGIQINAFLERSELIGKTTFTIAENLILGCLIVIFVVVLLLGNLRSGLVVASVIPLSLFFALSLMYVFDVDANLMSLGAIDFGIIIDGAVIIVEYTAFRITSERSRLMSLPTEDRHSLLDKITFQSASKMMNSAVFGQLIIIIVFIPILSLTNVEGKMFKPMALVFSFALVGAMILCFTYVPVVSSLFLKATNTEKKTISSQLIVFLQKQYRPSIIWGLRNKKWILSMATVLLLVVAALFSRMGGEFVPTLDEGDFVIQPVLKTGTSLSKTVEMTTRMEKILLGFPEVDQVVSRIGAAEVPTDPMSMEESDIIIKLKPKRQWVTANSKDELANRFKEALSVIPGIDFEFTQPIEMRFNELITGVRADVAIKIFGEDLDMLYQKAMEIEKAIKGIDGAADITVEKISGLPQMSVLYDRQKIAKYGLNTAELNKIISIGFAGLPAGTVFEGEKQFDLVVRFDESHRRDIKNIETASILLPNGNHLPLAEFATISYSKGPAKISRDNTKRRIVVGVNVRNRDLESVVGDIQRTIDSEIDLPVGYSIDYGGQFENLRSARERLMVAVPVALILIFILLYFAFGSVKEALLIYTAIPLASVGGVLLLYFRSMPFSISAGVGFIALFGIAVLNGIVLIEQFKELKAHGIHNINRRIIAGTQQRLRPVLLTASAAALGFLPMAISSSAGAEVQRPLATVVIGGLISATALTLIVLPVLYAIFDRKGNKQGRKKNRLSIALLALLIIPFAGLSQNKLSQEDAVELALKNNRALKASEATIDMNRQLKRTAFNPDKTQVYHHYDQNNIAVNGEPLRVWGISQSFDFPSIYTARNKVFRSRLKIAEIDYQIDEQKIRREVLKAYQNVLYWNSVINNQTYLDSLYRKFSSGAREKFELGESNYLEKLTAETKSYEISVGLRQTKESLKQAYLELYRWLQTDSVYEVAQTRIVKLELLPNDRINIQPQEQYFKELGNLKTKQIALERRQLLPDLQIEVFNGTNSGENPENYSGYQIGVAFPLFFGYQKARINATKTEELIATLEYEDFKMKKEAYYASLLSDLQKYQDGIIYYDAAGQILSRQLITHAELSFRNGEIDYLQYVLLMENAISIEKDYLDNLLKYNITILDTYYLTL